MFLNPIVNRSLLRHVPIPLPLNMIRLHKTRVLFPLIKRNKSTSSIMMTILLMLTINFSRQILSNMYLLIRNLRQHSRARILQSKFAYNVEDSRPLRRLLNHFLVLLKELKVSTPMIKSRLIRTLLLLTISTRMSQRRTRILVQRSLVLRYKMGPCTILRRRHLTRHRLQDNVVRNLT